jgi:hypothetical protein
VIKDRMKSIKPWSEDKLEEEEVVKIIIIIN